MEKLLGEVEGTVGVITPDAAFRDRVQRWLRVRRPNGGVVTALAAKGMEYDAVVLIEPGLDGGTDAGRTLYVALSRATQRLTTVATRVAPPPLSPPHRPRYRRWPIYTVVDPLS